MTDEKRQYRISDLSKEFGISFRALRFYEKKNLVTPERRGRQIRLYSESDRQKIADILRYGRMGFTLMRINDGPITKGDLEKQLENLEEDLANVKEQIALVRQAIKTHP